MLVEQMLPKESSVNPRRAELGTVDRRQMEANSFLRKGCLIGYPTMQRARALTVLGSTQL